MSKLDILCFAAHPDDVELSCGGTIAKHVDLGHSVGICDLTRGELGTRGNADTRRDEALKASEILKIKYRENLGLQDGFFDINEKNIIDVVKIIRKYKPKIVLCNATHDRHLDHSRAGDLVVRAAFLSGLVKINTNQDAWRPSALYRYIQDYHNTPDFVIDISKYMDIKLEAIKAYSTQFYNINSKEIETPISKKDFFDFIIARAKEFGRPAGFEFAEGFNKERYIGVDNLFHLI